MSNRPYFPILIALLLAFGLRSYRLDSQALRGDEAATVHYAAFPVGQLWQLSRLTDPHPPFFYLILHPWRAWVGPGEWGMRFVGTLAGTLTVAVLYALARRTGQGRGAALVAAFLLAVNPFHVWLSQDLRSYPLFTLLGLLSAGALWRALRTPRPRPGRWLLYTCLTVICFYTHYYTVLLIGFQALFVAVNAGRFWRHKWAWLVSQAGLGLLILPGLRLAANFAGSAAGGIETIPVAAILRRTATALLTGFTIGAGPGLLLSLLLAPLWLTGLLRLWRQNRTAAAFWSFYVAVPVLSVIGLSIDRPFFKERYLIAALPAFELLLAAGLIALRRQGRRGIALAGLMLVALLGGNLLALDNYFTDPAYAKATPWHLYGDYVARKARPGDVMLTNFPEAAVSYYNPALPFYVVPDERDRSAAYRLDLTEQIAGSYRRLWFLPLPHQGFDEENRVLHWLDRHADRVDQIFFPAYNLNLYLSPPAIEEAMIEQRATFGHGISLRGFQILDEAGDSRLEAGLILPLAPAESFNLSLYWQAGGPTDRPYTVFTHLIAADGFNRTGRDNQPVWGGYPTTAWQPGEEITDKYRLTIPPGTPPGDHRLHVGWYPADGGGRVPLVAAESPGTDYVILKAIIRVRP